MRTESPIIMLVDDDEDLLSLMKTGLEERGYRVDARTTAPRKEDITGLNPAVIFMDIGLRDENGAALCRAIKHDARATGTPVILISAHDDALLHQEAASGLADGCLRKPFSMEELHALAAQYAADPQAEHVAN